MIYYKNCSEEQRFLLNLLTYLFLDLCKCGHVGKVSLVGAGNLLGGLQVRDLPPDEVGEHAGAPPRQVELLFQTMCSNNHLL